MDALSQWLTNFFYSYLISEIGKKILERWLQNPKINKKRFVFIKLELKIMLNIWTGKKLKYSITIYNFSE